MTPGPLHTRPAVALPGGSPPTMSVHASQVTPDKRRCPWAGEEPLYVRYHDEEWGRPVHEDRTLFGFLVLEGAHGSFDAFARGFVGGKPIRRRPRSMKDLPATTAESDALSRALRARGFRCVGSTICYAFMQACGLVDDHVQGCFRAAKR